ncbi:MAG: hypothetical protein HWE19_10065 [Vibrionaceae bacterium]|nr:hypothetical protein [Vibrionaceae bacterium]
MSKKQNNEEMYLEHLDKILSDLKADNEQQTVSKDRAINNLESLKKRMLQCSGGEVTSPICGVGPHDAAFL